MRLVRNLAHRVRRAVTRLLGGRNRSRPPYAYQPGHTVVADYAEYSGLSIEAIEQRIGRFKEMNKAHWARLQGKGGAWDSAAREFYASADNYVFDHLSANQSGAVVVEKLDRFNSRILATIRSYRGKRFLEFGGGTGVFCETMAREGLDVTYLDIPGPVKDFAEWRFRKYKLPIKVITSTTDRVSLKENYDVVFTDAVFEHLIDPEQALRELISHVNEGGVFVFLVDLSGPTEDDPQHRHVDIVRLHDIIAEAGFGCEAGRTTFCSIWRRPGR